MSSAAPDDRRQGGQVIVVFALCLVAVVGMTGLVLDGGDTFLQRRTLQNVADSAAMAGAYAYAMTSHSDQAENRAVQMAMSNGLYHGLGSETAQVAAHVTEGSSASFVTVDVSKPHRNTFSAVMGFSSWGVSATATALIGKPNAVYGLMPVIFNEKTFVTFGMGPDTERAFDEPVSGSNDVPITDRSFNWTVFCTASGNACNGNSQDVDAMINGHGSTIKVKLDDRIGPLNAGAHATLFDDMGQWLTDEFPVAIVNDSGALRGFAIFHLTGSVGGSSKQLRGYFMTRNDPDFEIDPNSTGGTNAFGAYLVKLTN
jgi:hypothetical protein